MELNLTAYFQVDWDIDNPGRTLCFRCALKEVSKHDRPIFVHITSDRYHCDECEQDLCD